MNRLAQEYRLRPIYRHSFNEILAQEQDSQDFGGLLRKMGVLNERGESAMDADQWEAASEFFYWIIMQSVATIVQSLSMVSQRQMSRHLHGLRV